MSVGAMWRRLLVGTLLGALLVFLCGVHVARGAGVNYTIQAINPTGGINTIGAINSEGEVVGSYDYCKSCGTPGGYEIQAAFSWENGVFTPLTSTQPNVNSSYAFDVNNAGTIVGNMAINSGSEPVATVWPKGAMTGESIQSGATPEGWAYGINDSGDITGQYYNGSSLVAFLALPGQGPSSPNGLDTEQQGEAINDNREIAGLEGLAGFYWTPLGGSHPLDFSPNDINDAGTIVGGSQGATHSAYKWNGTDVPLGNLASFTNADARAINTAGTIVGYSGDDAVMWPTGSTTPLNLNTVLPANSGWILEDASGINDDGQIDGIGTLDGTTEGFLLTPNIPKISIESIQAPTPAPGKSAHVQLSVSLSSASAQAVTVHYATQDGTATVAGGNYDKADGTLTFPAGATSEPVTVTIHGVGGDVDNPYFLLNLSNPVNATIQGTGSGRATILTKPILQIGDASVVRPKKGEATAKFPVTISSWHRDAVKVSFKTADGSAKAAKGDYVKTDGSFTLAPGESSHEIEVKIPSTDQAPVRQQFGVKISSSDPVDLAKNVGTGTILPNPDKVVLSFSPDPLTADGFTTSTGQVTVTDSDGNPVAGQQVRISPPNGSPPYPRVLICGPSGALYPTLAPTTGDVTGHDFFENSDSGGQIGFNIRVGTQSANMLVNAAIPGAESASESDTERLQLDQGPTVTPDGIQLAKQLRIINLQGSVQVAAGPSSFSGEVAQETALQQVALDYLTTLKQSGNAALAGLDFAPVHSTDSMGHLDGGVLIYPSHGEEPQQAIASGGVVWDVSNLTEHGSAIPTFFPTVAEWQNGGPGFIAHGALVPGPVTPTPDDPLQYFGWPYPPPAQSIDARANYDATCVKSDPNAWGIQVHSPLSLVLRDSTGGEIGVDSHGKVVADAPGVIQLHGGKLEGLEVPPGNYSIALTGTGKGRAHIVFDVPTGHGVDHAWTLQLYAKRGATGKVMLGSGGPGAARFGGHRYRATRGIALVVHGLPRTLHHGHVDKLTLTVTDAFGATAAGMVVKVSGPHFHAAGVTNAAGRVMIRIPKAFKGKLRLVFGGPAYVKLTRTVEVR